MAHACPVYVNGHVICIFKNFRIYVQSENVWTFFFLTKTRVDVALVIPHLLFCLRRAAGEGLPGFNCYNVSDRGK